MAVLRLAPSRLRGLASAMSTADASLMAAFVAGDAAATATFAGWLRTLASHLLAHHFGAGSAQLAALVARATDELRRTLWIDAAGSGRVGLAGSQDLYAWLVVVLTRVACEHLTAQRPKRGVAGLAAQLIAVDAGLAILKAQHPRAFATALQDAVVALDVRLRNALTFLYVGGLTPQAVAAIYDVAPATVMQWDATARQYLVVQTRTNLEVR